MISIDIRDILLEISINRYIQKDIYTIYQHKRYLLNISTSRYLHQDSVFQDIYINISTLKFEYD